MIAPMQAIWDATMAGVPEWKPKFNEDEDSLYRLVSFCCLGHSELTALLDHRLLRPGQL